MRVTVKREQRMIWGVQRAAHAQVERSDSHPRGVFIVVEEVKHHDELYEDVGDDRTDRDANQLLLAAPVGDICAEKGQPVSLSKKIAFANATRRDRVRTTGESEHLEPVRRGRSAQLASFSREDDSQHMKDRHNDRCDQQHNVGISENPLELVHLSS